MSKNTYLIVVLISIFCHNASAQRDSLLEDLPNELEELIESFTLETQNENEFDFNALSDELRELANRKINLNKASYDDLDFGILNPILIQNLQNHIRKNGDLISIYELQSIDGFDVTTIKSILPFVQISSSVILKENLNPNQLLKYGESELLMRWTRILNEQYGYVRPENGYLGDPNQYFIRYKWQSKNKVRFGLTAEKDRGEEFFNGSNKNGFDFYSGHLFMKNIHPNIKSIALGDFNASFGQGLILQSGFNRSKGAQVLNIKNTRRQLRHYSSVNEFAFFRGVGFQVKLKNINWTAFASRRKIDGNVIVQNSPVDSGDSLDFVSSFLANGFHRTASEIEDERSVSQQTIGTSLGYHKRNFRLNGNFVFDEFSSFLIPRQTIANQFRFQGKESYNASLDYSYYYRNFHLFGEGAIDKNSSLAFTNGLLIGLGKYTNASFLFRKFERDFISIHGQPFAEIRATSNETGLYSGLSFRPIKSLQIDAYYDFWQHPWLRSSADAPSQGQEWLLKINFISYKKGEFYFQARSETKGLSFAIEDNQFKSLNSQSRTYYRVHFGRKITKVLEWRNRIEFSNINEGESKGFMAFQDIIWKPSTFPLVFKSRLAYYSTDDNASKIYAYENDVLNSFSVPAYFGEGSRFYLYLRYSAIENLSIEGRFSNTFRNTSEGIGSGNEEIFGKNRSDLKFQIKCEF